MSSELLAVTDGESAFLVVAWIFTVFLAGVMGYLVGDDDRRRKRPHTDGKLYKMLSEVYTQEAMWKWLDYADEQGWDLEERKRRMESLLTGAYE